eukprot:TRINITY_DN5669_c0_g1_i1.p1 TRINITY_DN5669_c0_g1~~TRINITY_DN5669_c0_g1_i1.p1  ORF type:complete len:291 (+),score=71.41 TRINITY_DN5669_c0_g1_i1:29-901(+)
MGNNIQLKTILNDPENDKILKQLFQKFDKNSNGSLDKAELRKLSKEFYKYLNSKEIPRESLLNFSLNLFGEIDSDGDEVITYTEFKNWCLKSHEQQETERLNQKNRKIQVLGERGIGKTSAIYAFKDKKFKDLLVIPDGLHSYYVSQKIGENTYNFNLLDHNGSDDGMVKFSDDRKKSYPESSVFVICFSLHDKQSFKKIETKWIPEIKEHLNTKNLILLGLQKDLRKTKQKKEGEVVIDVPEDDKGVDSRDANDLAKRIGAVSFFECSASCMDNLVESFDQILKLATQN